MLTNFKAIINGFVSKDKSKVLLRNIFYFFISYFMQKSILQSVKKYGSYRHFYVTSGPVQSGVKKWLKKMYDL